MKYDESAHEIVLSSGRRFYAYDGILSLDESASELTYGSDGGVPELLEDGPFTADERAEIADEQIRRWTAWKRDVPVEAVAAIRMITQTHDCGARVIGTARESAEYEINEYKDRIAVSLLYPERDGSTRPLHIVLSDVRAAEASRNAEAAKVRDGRYFVYDPRDHQWKRSRNPALILAMYMMNDLYRTEAELIARGPNPRVDWVNVAAQATYMDEPV